MMIVYLCFFLFESAPFQDFVLGLALGVMAIMMTLASMILATLPAFHRAVKNMC
jgi:ABC-type polysaccharide/polyol phosphate export permease